MIDPAMVASGYATQKLIDATDDDRDKHLEALQSIDRRLELVADALSRQATPDEILIVPLQPAPYGYQVKPYDRNHFNMFIPGTAPVSISFNVLGAGLYTKSLGPGWVQVDLPGGTEVYSGDLNNHNVIVAFCDDARGTAI